MKRTDQYIKMYQQGFSTYQIAKKFNRTPANIALVLKYWGVPRRHLGDDIEIKVMNWLEDRGHEVIRQGGKSPYDLLVNNQKIDIKSAHETYDKWNKKYSYSFQLQSMPNRTYLKNFKKEIDSFYLVFLNEDKVPMYKLLSKDVEATQTLRIFSHLIKKYPLKLVGYLE